MLGLLDCLEAVLLERGTTVLYQKQLVDNLENRNFLSGKEAAYGDLLKVIRDYKKMFKE